MITKIQKWGNSQGVRFSREILGKLHISVGDEVEISVHRGEIVVKPAMATRGKYNLKKLLSQMPEDYCPTEVDWGEPVGKEIW